MSKDNESEEIIEIKLISSNKKKLLINCILTHLLYFYLDMELV